MKKYKLCFYLLFLFSVLFIFSCKSTQSLNLKENTNIQYDKLDKNKELVNLSKEIEKAEIRDYKSASGKNQTGIVIKIPNINIKSKDAIYFNSQMNKFAKYKLDEYNNRLKNKFEWKLNVDYKFYQSNDILSVIVFGYNNEGKKNYYKLDDYPINAFSSINIDLKTGNKISDKEMLKKFNIDKFEERVISYIHSQFPIENLKLNSKEDIKKLDMYKLSISRSLGIFWEGMYFSQLKPNTEDTTYWVNYDETVKPNLFYNSDSDNLSVNIKLISHDVRRKKFEYRKGDFLFKNFDISKIKPKNIKLNKVYEYYAKKKGINPNSKDAPLLFSGYIGYYNLNDEAINNFQGVINNSNIDLKKLSCIETEHNNENIVSKGNELYLLIPKYDEISLEYNIMDFDMNNPERYFTHGVDNIGNTLLRANISELFNDCVINIAYRDKMIKYEPNQSLVDGSNSVVKGVVDITDIIKKDSSKNAKYAAEFFSKVFKN